MKAMNKLVWFAAVLGCLVWRGSPLHAQDVSSAHDGGEALHSQQLAAEREALVTMLNDGNTPAERRVSIQRLLNMHWVQSCPRHGKYSGTGALTGCPKCVGYIR
jgi:hypothetical protein